MEAVQHRSSSRGHRPSAITLLMQSEHHALLGASNLGTVCASEITCSSTYLCAVHADSMPSLNQVATSCLISGLHPFKAQSCFTCRWRTQRPGANHFGHVCAS